VREVLENWILPISLISIALICASTIQLLTPRLKNVAIDDGVRRLEDVPFPFLSQTSEPVMEYRVTAEIDRSPYQFERLTLMPTLCLPSAEINGQPLVFNKEDSSGHCDFIRGYDVLLPAHVQGGQSLSLNTKISTNFEIFGLSVRAPSGDPFVLTLRLIAIATLAAGLYLALRRWQICRSASLILVASLPVQMLYIMHTPPIERTYDVLGHLQHIEFIADHLSLPASDFCHECYQPSLYYSIAAAIYSMARIMRIFDPMVVLQFFSLAWFWLFIVMSVRIFLLWLPEEREAQLATALLAFWPGGFLHSPRISNDIPLYAFFAIDLYFVLKWWKTGRRRDLLVAACVAGCGVLIKATMMILVGTIGTLMLYRIFSERQSRKAWTFCVAPALLMVAGIGAYIAQSFAKGGIFLPVWRLYPSMYVGNSWKQYLLLDIGSYFKSPFVDSIRAGTGREYFWNYVLKSSMFGDYDWFQKPAERLLAVIMSALLLGLVVLFFIGIARELRGPARRALPLLVVIALSFLSLFVHRFSNPYSANNDFRFIYPVLIPIVLLIAEGARNGGVKRAFCYSFCGLSAAFYLTV
jgi:hypothetical protein